MPLELKSSPSTSLTHHGLASAASPQGLKRPALSASARVGTLSQNGYGAGQSQSSELGAKTPARHTRHGGFPGITRAALGLAACVASVVDSGKHSPCPQEKRVIRRSVVSPRCSRRNRCASGCQHAPSQPRRWRLLTWAGTQHTILPPLLRTVSKHARRSALPLLQAPPALAQG